MLYGLSEIIRLALNEDILTGDITSESTIPENALAKAYFLSKDEGIVAGLDVAYAVFHAIDQEIIFKKIITDGNEVSKGQIIAEMEGKARSLLTAERTALNFLQRLSGVATNTSRYVRAVADYRATIIDTRKTMPGWRTLEKYAVRIGGGRNHRFGLYDAVLIKDNHIVIAGSITKAVAMAKERIPHTMKIEVETENLDQVAEALKSNVDIIMLDNMSLDMMSEAVGLINGKALVEASGGVRLENVVDIAKTGVDLISIGALTHSAMPLDISMEMGLET